MPHRIVHLEDPETKALLARIGLNINRQKNGRIVSIVAANLIIEGRGENALMATENIEVIHLAVDIENVLMIAGVVVEIEESVVKAGGTLVSGVAKTKTATANVPHSRIQNQRNQHLWSHQLRSSQKLSRTRLLTL